jgi:tRNA U38,U39,U40 pseudouridine synthase TruA
MVGALLDIGRGRLDLDALGRLLKSPQPGAALLTTPPEGLTLERVYYRSFPHLSCGKLNQPTHPEAS